MFGPAGWVRRDPRKLALRSRNSGSRNGARDLEIMSGEQRSPPQAMAGSLPGPWNAAGRPRHRLQRDIKTGLQSGFRTFKGCRIAARAANCLREMRTRKAPEPHDAPERAPPCDDLAKNEAACFHLKLSVTHGLECERGMRQFPRFKASCQSSPSPRGPPRGCLRPLLRRDPLSTARQIATSAP